MTTIEEAMDEFFNFDQATHSPTQQHHLDFSNAALGSGPYDIDLAFAEPETDENSFTCLQHFSAPEEALSYELAHGYMDTTMMGPDDFTDFPRWIDGMDVPSNPCAYCRRLRLHCKVLREGIRKGSCTSCVALARSCSLTTPSPFDNPKSLCSQSEVSAGVTSADVPEFDAASGLPLGENKCCDSCRSQQLNCNVIQDAENPGSCYNCLACSVPCSLSGPKERSEWMRDDSTHSKAVSHSPRPPVQQRRSSTSLSGHHSSSDNLQAAAADAAPKNGARFSRESLRILKAWLATHAAHPYPSDEEKENLRRQTGLNKTQIINWLANARRRGKVRAPRSVSPSVRNYPNAIDIPRRAGTPALENMNPLERWKHSPPENEPASITAISRAVTSSAFSSGLNSPHTSHGISDDGSSRSICNVSSTSSLGTSQSSGHSFASAFSHRSQGSLGSFGSFGNRGRRRRRKAAAKPVKAPPMFAAARTYQCTFCTETFKTKHDWQRHEKSLHLSLERWVCCPTGPAQFCADYGHNRCVFCGLPNPDQAHAEVHNYTNCAERSLEERTFYRKDHLRQHLNLVHDVKFQSFSMETWKVITPEIRSRCGFCGVVMDSWSFRVDHLAEHFKGGKSMADWKGDWGFEPQVLDIVENGMPPYLIHDERNTMDPYEASKEAADSKKTLEDQVKMGLLSYIHDHVTSGKIPTDNDLLVEARIIIRKFEILSPENFRVSWFRDLLMPLEELADNGPAPSHQKEQHKSKFIAGEQNHRSMTTNPFTCSKERALDDFVHSKLALGLTATDRELQVQCCRILEEIEPGTNFKSQEAVKWFQYLTTASTEWLGAFRRRAGLPRSSEMASEIIRSKDDKSIDYSINNHARLVRELRDWVQEELSRGKTPSDDELQSEARLIVYKNDDPWNQTAIDDPKILLLFKRQSGLAESDQDGASCLELPTVSELLPEDLSPRTLHWNIDSIGVSPISPRSASNSGTPMYSPTSVALFDNPVQTLAQIQPTTNSNPTQSLTYFLNDSLCYGRLMRELHRFVTSTMSPNNPNQHVPTDAEIQNQARWVIYDDDDPWNQTAADNAEWLIRFKRGVGLLPSSGPGLPLEAVSWNVSQGGSGFSPPFLCPKENVTDAVLSKSAHVYDVNSNTARSFLKNISSRYQPPASIFCSRELEDRLAGFVREQLAQGLVPTDQQLRDKARMILNVGPDQPTAADEHELLEKFKTLHGIGADSTMTSIPQPNTNVTSTILEMDDEMIAQFNMELDSMDLTGLDIPIVPDLPAGMSLQHTTDQPDIHDEPFVLDLPAQIPLTHTTPLAPRHNSFSSSVSSSLEMMYGLGSSSGIQVSPSTIPPILNINTHSNSRVGVGAGSGIQISPKYSTRGEGVARDYAEMYRVETATASPLRRASLVGAKSKGFKPPTVEDLGGREVRMMSFPEGEMGDEI